MRKNIVAAVAAAIILGGAAGLWVVNSKDTAQQPAASPTPVVCATETVEQLCYTGEDGKTAYALLKEKYQVEEKDTSFGPMILGINGKIADDKHYWSFYVNGTFASVGADKYDSKTGDKIEWKYEEIQ